MILVVIIPRILGVIVEHLANGKRRELAKDFKGHCILYLDLETYVL